MKQLNDYNKTIMTECRALLWSNKLTLNLAPHISHPYNSYHIFNKLDLVILANGNTIHNKSCQKWHEIYYLLLINETLCGSIGN